MGHGDGGRICQSELVKDVFGAPSIILVCVVIGVAGILVGDGAGYGSNYDGVGHCIALLGMGHDKGE